MKKSILAIAIALLQISLIAQDSVDTTSYSLGMSVGARMANQGASDIDYDSFIKGLQATLEKQETLITKNQSDSINYVYFQSQQDKMFDKVKEDGLKYLEENAKRPEVSTTESGLQYQVIAEGDGGAKPTASSTVTVHYVGQLITGEMFDSSVDRGEPISFPLNRVIPGWTEGLQLMTVGSKYRLFIPYELGYGARGAGAAIPPYSTLIFDVELLAIK